ncbi:unnamed protein product [Periconia digitata]|uniref:EXS domain-containing protein n=1 Tax=Periconia digitata TaxID=1303443 RepID=A0A9W4US29_9PLEO|nr:unnamed protein product [Periconia digitata]
MEGDDPIEPQLDGFSRILPLPYRVALIIVMGIWAWGLNLQYLSLIRIDVPSLIRYPARNSPHHPPHYLSCYRVATALSIPLAASLLLFWTVTAGSPTAIISWSILPNLYLLVLVVGFIVPLPSVSRAGRHRTLATLKRISIGGIAEAADGKFGDILLADALTSYAKVLGDLFVVLCMAFSSSAPSTTALPNRNCGGPFLIPFIISIPSLIRLRQCLTEYSRVQAANRKAGHSLNGWGGVHLANAAKYSTAFPVILLSALLRSHDPEQSRISETALFRLWLTAVFVNSAYSFYWDVTRDWDLTLFKPRQRSSAEYPWGLRRHRWFHAKEFYYAAVCLDALLRCTWSVKLSPHLDHFNDLEGGIFVMEALEVVRRWVWIFFRVECEWVRTHRNSPSSSSSASLLAAIENAADDDDSLNGNILLADMASSSSSVGGSGTSPHHGYGDSD